MIFQVHRIPSLCKNRHLLAVTNLFAQSTRYTQSKKDDSKLVVSRDNAKVSTHVTPIIKKIKENTKTASYAGIILLGASVTAVMFFAIFRELFSSSSPNSIYSKALERVINNTKVQDALGAPIKGFGEESRRRRRQHVANTSYQRNGVNFMRMQFYVQGIRNKATVHLEMREGSSGKYEYRYLFVQLDYYPHTTIILEDNRANDQKSYNMKTNDLDLKPIV